MKKGLIYIGLSIFIGFGTNFLIRFLRDGDFYYAEFFTSMIGAIMISVGAFLKKGSKESDRPRGY